MKAKKALIVDDDDFVLAVIDNAVQEAGYLTVKCSNGQEAIDMVQRYDFDVIITDIIMPEKNGVQFISEMRTKGIKTPVIVISGDQKGQSANDFLEFACYFANDILKKPIRKEHLISVLDSVTGPCPIEAFKNL